MPREKATPKPSFQLPQGVTRDNLDAAVARGPECDHERHWFDYGPYTPDAVQIRPSGIPGAGIGAFAIAPIPAGALVGEYTGRIVPTGTPGDYVLDTGAGYAIDAEDTRWGSWTRFVNSPGGPPNLEFVKGVNEAGQFTIFLRALRSITPGEELICDYGAHY